MNKRRYLFFDIDGTLMTGGYEDGYIPESAQKALALLKENGHFLAIATGRANFMARPIMRYLGFENMVSDGGYGITIDDKFYGAIPLPGEPVVRLIAECVALSMPWAIQTDNTVYRTAPDSRFEDFTHDPYMKTRVVPGLDPRSFDKIYKAYIACLPGEEQKLETLRELPWCRYHNEYFFVEPTDKSVGIKQILDKLGADYSDAIVFGDALNDMSMFTDDWTKVAMGNACPELKARADLITTNVEDNGIYNACVTLGLF